METELCPMSMGIKRLSLFSLLVMDRTEVLGEYSTCSIVAIYLFPNSIHYYLEIIHEIILIMLFRYMCQPFAPWNKRFYLLCLKSLLRRFRFPEFFTCRYRTNSLG